MAVSLRGPVGRRGRTQNVTNSASDQGAVIDLLASIPGSKGGKAEAWANAPLSGPSGSCPQLLADAIWDFQTYWKGRGTFHSIDGVVDPGGRTLAQLNSLASGGSGIAAGAAGGAAAALGGAAGGGGTAAAQGTSVDAFTRGLRTTFGFPTDWKFSGGAGGGTGVFVFAAGLGRLDFSRATPAKESGSIKYGFLGGTIGFDGGPDFTFSYSTDDMTTIPLGVIHSRNPLPLTLDDFAGPMFVFSFTAAPANGAPIGASMTVYMLGVSTVIAVGGLLYPPMMLQAASMAMTHAKAIGVTTGEVRGIDASVTIAPGYAKLV